MREKSGIREPQTPSRRDTKIPRRPSCRHRMSAAHYKYTSVSNRNRKPNTTSTSTSATSESYRVIPERYKRHYYKLLTKT
jgi:hypothetical protein